MKRGKEDPVSSDLRTYVLARDRGCVVGILVEERYRGPCRDGNGELRDPREVGWWTTIAHVRDRGLGGRMAKRPPSVPRHVAAVCYGHHLADPIIDRGFVRDLVDAYLERLEGPVAPSSRPHERIARVRSAEAMLLPDPPAGTGGSSSSEGGKGAAVV